MDNFNCSNPLDTFGEKNNHFQAVLNKINGVNQLIIENDKAMTVILTLLLKNVLDKQEERGEFLDDYQKACLLEHMITMSSAIERSSFSIQTITKSTVIN